MAVADTQSYEEVISGLQTFMAAVEEECSNMESAAQDVVDNTQEDVAAQKASGKVTTCVANVRASLETIGAIIAALQDEMEKMIEAANKMDSDD